MAELTGWPTDGAEGSVSSEARWRKMARLWASSGVVTGLVPTLGSGVINVTAGSAWLDGHYAELTSPASEANSANGLLVVRFTPADNSFELVYRDGVSTPTQTDAVWELPIAQMTAGAMADRRTMSGTGPGGQLAYVETATAQTNIGTSSTDLVGLTAPAVSLFSPRRLRISGHLQLVKAATSGLITIRVQEAAVILGHVFNNNVPTTERALADGSVVFTAPAGAHTYRLTGLSGAGTMNVESSATNPSYILVEDIGAA